MAAIMQYILHLSFFNQIVGEKSLSPAPPVFQEIGGAGWQLFRAYFAAYLAAPIFQKIGVHDTIDEEDDDHLQPAPTSNRSIAMAWL